MQLVHCAHVHVWGKMYGRSPKTSHARLVKECTDTVLHVDVVRDHVPL